MESPNSQPESWKVASARTRVECPMVGCDLLLARERDLERHFEEVHVDFKRCIEPGCTYHSKQVGRHKAHLVKEHGFLPGNLSFRWACCECHENPTLGMDEHVFTCSLVTCRHVRCANCEGFFRLGPEQNGTADSVKVEEHDLENFDDDRDAGAQQSWWSAIIQSLGQEVRSNPHVDIGVDRIELEFDDQIDKPKTIPSEKLIPSTVLSCNPSNHNTLDDPSDGHNPSHKEFSCVCGYVPGGLPKYWEAKLTRHIRSCRVVGQPKSEKIWRCDFPKCGKAFSRSDNLRAHQRSKEHDQIDPLEFGLKTSLLVAPDSPKMPVVRPWTCDFPDCGQSFTNLSSLCLHEEAEKHGRVPYGHPYTSPDETNLAPLHENINDESFEASDRQALRGLAGLAGLAGPHKVNAKREMVNETPSKDHEDLVTISNNLIPLNAENLSLLDNRHKSKFEPQFAPEVATQQFFDRNLGESAQVDVAFTLGLKLGIKQQLADDEEREDITDEKNPKTGFQDEDMDSESVRSENAIRGSVYSGEIETSERASRPLISRLNSDLSENLSEHFVIDFVNANGASNESDSDTDNFHDGKLSKVTSRSAPTYPLPPENADSVEHADPIEGNERQIAMRYLTKIVVDTIQHTHAGWPNLLANIRSNPMIQREVEFGGLNGSDLIDVFRKCVLENVNESLGTFQILKSVLNDGNRPQQIDHGTNHTQEQQSQTRMSPTMVIQVRFPYCQSRHVGWVNLNIQTPPIKPFSATDTFDPIPWDVIRIASSYAILAVIHEEKYEISEAISRYGIAVDMIKEHPWLQPGFLIPDGYTETAIYCLRRVIIAYDIHIEELKSTTHEIADKEPENISGAVISDKDKVNLSSKRIHFAAYSNKQVLSYDYTLKDVFSQDLHSQQGLEIIASYAEVAVSADVHNDFKIARREYQRASTNLVSFVDYLRTCGEAHKSDVEKLEQVIEKWSERIDQLAPTASETNQTIPEKEIEEDNESDMSDFSRTASLASIANSIFSMPSVSSMSSAIISGPQGAIERLVSFLLCDTEIKPLCTEGLSSITPTRFERNLRRLLKEFAVALRKEAETAEQKQAAHFVRYRSRNTAHIICSKLNETPKILETRTRLPMPTTLVTIDEELEQGDVSDNSSDSERDEDATDNLQHLEIFLLKSLAIKLLRERLRNFVYPPASISRIGKKELGEAEAGEKSLDLSESDGFDSKKDLDHRDPKEEDAQINHTTIFMNPQQFEEVEIFSETQEVTETNGPPTKSAESQITISQTTESSGTEEYVISKLQELLERQAHKENSKLDRDVILLVVDILALPANWLWEHLPSAETIGQCFKTTSEWSQHFVDDCVKPQLPGYRPPVKPGQTRIEMTCQCGQKIIDDYTEHTPGGLDRFRESLKDFSTKPEIKSSFGKFAKTTSKIKTKQLPSYELVFDRKMLEIQGDLISLSRNFMVQALYALSTALIFTMIRLLAINQLITRYENSFHFPQLEQFDISSLSISILLGIICTTIVISPLFYGGLRDEIELKVDELRLKYSQLSEDYICPTKKEIAFPCQGRFYYLQQHMYLVHVGYYAGILTMVLMRSGWFTFPRVVLTTKLLCISSFAFALSKYLWKKLRLPIYLSRHPIATYHLLEINGELGDNLTPEQKKKLLMFLGEWDAKEVGFWGFVNLLWKFECLSLPVAIYHTMGIATMPLLRPVEGNEGEAHQREEEKGNVCAPNAHSGSSSHASTTSSGSSMVSLLKELRNTFSFKSSQSSDSEQGLPLDTLPTSNPTTQTATPDPTPLPPPEPLFLLLCYPSGRYATRLLQLDLHSLNAKCDQSLFTLLRTNYLSMRNSMFSLKRLKCIKFVQFEMYQSELVDVRKTDDVPPPENEDYRYMPTPLDVVPPVGEGLMMHLFTHPTHAASFPRLLSRLPKKLHTPLQFQQDDEIYPSWGLQYLEEWDGAKLWCITFVLFGGGSLLWAVLWVFYGHSLQDAFAVSAYIIAMVAVFGGTSQALLVM